MVAYIPVGKAPRGLLGCHSPLWLLVYQPVLCGLQQYLCRRDSLCSFCVNKLWGEQRKCWGCPVCSAWDVGILWDVGDIWGSVPITGATGPSCAVCGREAGWYRHSLPQNPPLALFGYKLCTTKFLQLFFSPLGLCPCECLKREVSRATGRKWEDGGEIRRTIICVLIKYTNDGNP